MGTAELLLQLCPRPDSSYPTSLPSPLHPRVSDLHPYKSADAPWLPFPPRKPLIRLLQSDICFSVDHANREQQEGCRRYVTHS